jgi:hypothetical protein
MAAKGSRHALAYITFLKFITTPKKKTTRRADTGQA